MDGWHNLEMSDMDYEFYFRAEKMTVGYDHKPLIEEIQIELKKGEILALIGPNGAGKSTVLKSITKQLALLGGTVYLGKDDMSVLSGADLSQKMAVVLTQRLQTELMSCEEVVATGRYPYTGRFGILTPEDNKVVEEAMELVHVTEIRDRDFRCISDGQRQRVMLARALCQEPDIIVLDEPTSYLDVKYKLEFLSVLQEMSRKKALTVILSLHELELAQRIADKILCLNGTRVDRYGSPDEIFQSGYLSGLFGIKAGSFDEVNGNLELPAPAGKAKVFVIAGGGSGRSVYRRLQREGIPFATGILYENDLDYPVAAALAQNVIVAKAFEPMTEELFEQAKKVMDECESVICCRDSFGSLEQLNAKMVEYAMQTHKLGMKS